MRARVWVVGGAGIGLLLVCAVVLVVHELAPTRWPDLAIRWSPSVDHVMWAALTAMRLNPAGIDGRWMGDVTARFTPEQLERSARRGGGYAVRAGMFLAMRALDPVAGGQGDAAAVYAQMRLLRLGDVIVRRSVLAGTGLPAHDQRVVAFGLRDPDPLVRLFALAACNPHRLPAPRIGPDDVACILAMCVARPQPCRVSDLDYQTLLDLRGRMVLRDQTSAEAEATAAEIRDSALVALVRVDAEAGLAEVLVHPPGVRAMERFCQALVQDGDRARLERLVQDPAWSAPALAGLWSLAWGHDRPMDAAAWLTVHRLGGDLLAKALEREDPRHLLRRLSTLTDLAGIGETIPDAVVQRLCAAAQTADDKALIDRLLSSE